MDKNTPDINSLREKLHKCLEETINLVHAELFTEVPEEFDKACKYMKEEIFDEIKSRLGTNKVNIPQKKKNTQDKPKKEKYIKLSDLQNIPIRKDHYDKENGNELFVFGIETAIEYAEHLPYIEMAEEDVQHDKV